MRCWFDEKDLKVGRRILGGLLSAIRERDYLVLCCTETALSSNWVATEIEEALEREKELGRTMILPLDLDGFLFDGWKGEHAVEIRKRLAADFVGWEKDDDTFERGFARLCDALRAAG